VGESGSPKESLKITIEQKQIVEKDDDDSKDRNPEVVDDDDDKEREKKDDEIGSLEIKNEETQKIIPILLSSPRKILSSDKKTFQELTDIVSNPTISTSKHSTVKKRISSKYSHLPGVLRMMCMCQGYMIQDMEMKCVTTAKFWETHNKIDDILHEVVPQTTENVTNDLIEANLKPCIVNTIIEDRDAFRSEVPAFISQEFKAHAPAIIEELFKNHVKSNVIHVHPTKTTTTSTEIESSANLQYQLYLKIKRNHQDRADDIALWEALRHKFEKSSTSNTSCREDDFHSHHDEHQDDDAPLEGEKRVKRSKKSKRSKFAKEWDAWEKKYILSLHKIHAEEFPEPYLEEKLNRWVRKEFNTFNEDARLSIQHWKDSWHKRVYKQNQKKVRKNPKDYYSNHKIIEVIRIVTDQPHGLDFLEQILVMRVNDKPDSFSEVDFKYLNKNNIKELYNLCRSKEIDNRKVKLMNSLITFIKSCVIWERVHDFQLGIESYQMKVNLTTPTLTFPDEKRVMYLEEIVKFCDATLEKVLNEVKLRMFKSKFLKKPPLLGELDQGIMKAYEREISKRLSHGQQMRRWESFVNGRPILPMMKRL
ncbi:hypothetical protein Tco_1008598, partial [Tanacetum coccineum]